METKYNGWANYATWRVNLEVWDGHDWSGERYDDAAHLAQYLEDTTDEYLTNFGEIQDGLAINYARAFLSDVDWREITEHIIADNPEILGPDEDDEDEDAA